MLSERDTIQIRFIFCPNKGASAKKQLGDLKYIFQMSQPNDFLQVNKRKIGIFKFILEVEKLLQDSKPQFLGILRSRAGYVLKLTFKNPLLVWKLCFACREVGGLLQNTSTEDAIDLMSKEYWWSPSGIRYGFPIPMDSHEHGLAPFRDDQLKAFVFNIWSDSEPKVYQEVEISRANIEPRMNLLSEWSESSFYQVYGARILNGENLVIDKKVIPLVIEPETKFQRNSRKFSATWMERGKSTINLVKPWMRREQVEGASVFVESDRNFYHFVSEALRAVMFCVEKGIPIENVMVKDSCPESFYELIRKICPDSKIIRLKQGSDVLVENLTVCVLGNNFASQDSNFSVLDGGEKFRITDEFRTWELIRKVLSNSSFWQSHKNIVYISRPRNQSRGVLFESRIRSMIRKSGGKVLTLQETFNQSYFSSFMHAGTLICSDGAGAANLIFMRPGSTLIEMGNRVPGWKNLADAMNIEYRFIPSAKLIPSNLMTHLDFTTYAKRNLSRALRDLN